MVRAPFFDKNGVRKGAWSKEEDDKLKAYIEKYGHWNWRELPKFAGLSRCGKSCRLRWMNYLRPDVKHGNYNKEEDDLIMQLHEQIGNKWSAIAAKLPGRTDNEIKNYWHTHLKKRVKQNKSKSNMREQSSQTSGTGISMSIEEVESVRVDTPSHTILESSPLSPEAYCTMFSQLRFDSAPKTASETNWTAEDNPPSFETYDDSSGDFWTEPFVADNIVNHDPYKFCFEHDGGFMSPYVSDFDCLFYEGMQELRMNSPVML
ncbi:hypothetical protein K2173_018811 [Erythroxylum novogranatense]|uniref:Uncharacterized protein n=1 Tax=Erythroxylum novogranatense TaxID=1862640 RepID=A0AAV8SB21_9ROSI|nr:hypothetical protein K2173_018811 [Erythroxylum novogranatense]